MISVAMATYNGEKYIKEQIDSILNQLKEDDEIVISDDGSKDNTISIIKAYKDSRIKLVEGPHNGVKQNFANAISRCKGDYIFLSDQDDIWTKNKVEEVLKAFKDTKVTCVVHDCDVINGENNKVLIESFFKYRGSKSGIFNNIFRNKYLGCCMAFTNEMKKFILPIPNDIEMHDQWIGIICEKHGKACFLQKKLFHYRRHGDNTSSMHHYPLWKMIRNRVVLIRRYIGR